MLSFESDYNNGAHPNILKRLVETNDTKSRTYGYDLWSDSARSKIKAACGCPDAQIWFLVGGTQTNATVIDSLLHTYEGVVSVDTGHINTHEAGAIEFTEHKVITIKGRDGKMDAQDLDNYMDEFLHDGNAEHCVYPGMVYITFPTELGTLYTARELDSVYQVCRKYDLPLYVDGARLGYGLMAEENDITLPYLAKHCDAFYIGGTKVGALCGEAVVFTHNNAHPHFFNIIKQHGALVAKGRTIGLQFDALFTDNLYFDISRHAIKMAMKMKKIFKKKGYRFLIDSPTNQQFVILHNDEMARLAKHVHFTVWGKYDRSHTSCRFVTSWATTEEEVEELRTIVMSEEETDRS
ncbi:Beta-eliminating lyase [Hallella bergensis DSM 17361]|uniref:Beta-eliminating lyase n=1 Tax=Hallella bergensis DSM 17361 TaxID=585502 RepID=D1PWM2_9BACT|nr:beta-eliminating lyase-related protein [Hallella bergensis]EFA44203.1 Beta-eliminating lyase [Hallella bergensis DSM 17361]